VTVNKLSVFETMREMLRLSTKHFRLLVVIGTVQATPSLASGIVVYLGATLGMKYLAFLALPILIITLILQAVCRAAVLGVLSAPAPELALTSMRTAIRTRTWTLVRVSILLALIAIPIELLSVCFAAMFAGFKLPGIFAFISIMLGVLFLIFLKYALADPLVVTKGTNATESLKASWQMTCGHFGYVMLCYLLLGGVLAVIQHLTPKLTSYVTAELILAAIYTLASAVLSTTWIVLAWVMYKRIIEADALPGDAPPTPAPEVA
jgi:hypothetical protein